MLRRQDLFTRQYEMSRKYFKIFLKIIKKLHIPISTHHNALYNTDDFIRALVHMSNGNHFFASTADNLLQSCSLDCKDDSDKHPPSAEWVLENIRSVNLRSMSEWCRNATDKISTMAIDNEMINSGDTVAIDITDIEYYGKGLEDYTRKTKPKNGTSTFFSYIMVQSIGHDYNIPLGAWEVPQDTNEHILVRKMLQNLDRIGATPGLVLADRGFFSVEGINCLKEDGRKFVMPAVKNPRVKTAIHKYHGDKKNPVSTFSIRNKHGEQAEFKLIIVEKSSWKESDEIVDRCVAFATNISDLTDKELVEVLPKNYRERWMIETGFRMIKENLGRTCSKYVQVRRFLFYFSMLLYSMWMLTKFEDANTGYHAGGDEFTLKLFVGCMTRMIDKIIQNSSYHLEFVS